MILPRDRWPVCAVCMRAVDDLYLVEDRDADFRRKIEVVARCHGAEERADITKFVETLDPAFDWAIADFGMAFTGRRELGSVGWPAEFPTQEECDAEMVGVPIPTDPPPFDPDRHLSPAMYRFMYGQDPPPSEHVGDARNYPIRPPKKP